MRNAKLLALATSVVFMIAACGGAPAGNSLAPGATPTPVTGSTPIPPPPIDVSQLCAGMPTFSLQTPRPSFGQDEVLNARFPTQIDGQPVTNVHSFFWLQSACYGSSSESLQRFAAIFPPSSLPGISSGTATATVNGETVSISAFRIPGTDPSVIFSHIGEFLAAFGIDPTKAAQYSVSQGNIGGRNVYIVTDPDGSKSYDLVSGDTVFTASSDDEAVVTKVFAAIQ